MKLVLKLKPKVVIELQGEGGLVLEQGRASMKPAKTEPKPGNTCPECRKSFPSEKALYGHMRCHPQRNYRGMNPPNSAAQNNLFATVSNSGQMRGSGITAERPAVDRKSAAARPRKNPVPAPWEPADGRPVPSWKEVGSCLSLAQKDPVKADIGGLSSSKMTRPIEDDEDEEDYYSGDGYEYEDVYQRNLNRLSGPKGEDRENKEELKSNTSNQTTSEMVEEKTTKKRKLSAIEDEVVTGGRFKCGTCGKSFSSHQALGGHKTSHRKGKTPSSPTGQEKEMEASQAKTHFCRICRKGFPSGQALGGHQRLHRQGDAPITAATAPILAQFSFLGSKEEEKEDEEGAVEPVLGFDLNEFPAMEEEDMSVSRSEDQWISA